MPQNSLIKEFLIIQLLQIKEILMKKIFYVNMRNHYKYKEKYILIKIMVDAVPRIPVVVVFAFENLYTIYIN